ncbi:phospho-N-acetylmuramoyl-pentapeptide-transferase [Campylobacter sp. VicNov18]|uniref:phospho-N-acetylmuramoyl-pentapeptide- transferase n=1 Tax=Campylobacter bilis TaxID=2691918 RepID=UPI00130E1CB8|nr:phospho-N-acetylmuramoyl-pentapeptide-transferase [Campylobacter bilis]MPV63984.1 phospho-N-acetylmuramoyl-pentapeptide-transferase [Campylobacter hepaticus]MBM0637485.1 phospho-N-acetylmuramoyl-pentapeptide-transferase [Campylobacter bilis]MCC8278208.1 phospho-N-acetylmuramoyl-pentapeptide-transferase [Campylobacter bilis]MCC8299712.1 phospho-N-acetylmuramoyl-pentapeptide-transferase [Campylobacter bilis]MCC8301117.1 phospho-N-acetylmuramoyl-pentapeptide-transferase [Campylobacter bilis]
MYYLSDLSNYAFFTYISVRAGFAFFIALCLSLLLMPRFIAWAKTKNASQPIYQYAPKAHKIKSHTPTMGGVIFISSAIIASLFCIQFDNIFAISALLCLVLFCLIGLVDDLGKVLKKDNHSGLSPRIKLLAQITVGLICILPLYLSKELSTELFIPFYKHPLFNMEIFAIVFWILVLISSSNAVNLTDGLDGLATVPSIFSLSTLGIFLYLSGNLNYSEYLLLPKIQGLSEVVIICAALIGALIGFLWYNCYPAQIFMGDSGSLALGGFIGFLAIISKNEILLLLIGFVFVLETISVILQVGSFKIFNKRVFKMAPIHHHFEKIGWVENKIIVRFWMIALLANLLALASIKLR